MKSYLFNVKTREKFPINGSKRSDRAVAAVPIQDLVGNDPGEIASAVDLRDFMSQVERQLDSNSCVANSLVGAYEYLLRRHNQDERDMSRLFVYYNAREKDPAFGGEIFDSGCFIGDAIEALKQVGTCTEDKWTYEQANLNEKPPADCYEEAKDFIVTDAVEVGVDLQNMKTCLSRGFPFVFSLKLFQSFARAAKNGGHVSMPKPDEPPLDNQDQHAMLAVGYNDKQQVFIVRNSWGDEWGDGGYGRFPYPYLSNPEYCSDVYAIRKLANFDLPKDHWVDDPSMMRSVISRNLGASEDGEDDWKVIHETLQSDLESSTDSFDTGLEY